MIEPLLIIVAGFTSGLLAGFFGVGGGLLLTPFIRIILNRPENIALGTTLPIIIPAAVAGLVGRRGKGYFVRNVFLFSSAGAVLGTTTGALLTTCINKKFLMITTAVLMVFNAFVTLAEKKVDHVSSLKKFKPSRKNLVMFFVGIFAGFLSGLLGLGGGLVLVPGFLMLGGLSAHEAVTTSLAVVFVAAGLGSLFHSELKNIDWLLALYLGTSTPFGAYIGSKLSVLINNSLLKKMFGIFLAVAGIWFLLFEILG